MNEEGSFLKVIKACHGDAFIFEAVWVGVIRKKVPQEGILL